MSASSSENAAKSVAGQEGLVGSHVAATGPQTTHGVRLHLTSYPYTHFASTSRAQQLLTRGQHQVGREPGPPVYHATVLPPGSAPAESTFKPNNMTETPGQSADNYSVCPSLPSTLSSFQFP